MKGTAGILAGSMAMLISGICHAQTSTNAAGFSLLSTMTLATNSAAPYKPAEAAPATNRNENLPLIEMHDVPIRMAIENLARQSGINYMVDRRVMQEWINSREPAVTFKLQNVAAADVLQRMLAVHKLSLVENPATTVARVTSSDQTVDAEDAGLLASLSTNNPAVETNALIPLIQFSDVPLDVALEHLARQSGFKFDYEVQLRNLDGSPWFASMPSVSIRWENITAIQAIFALCENYDLTVTRDDATGVLRIEPKQLKRHHHLQLR